jgi:hypothetical protein
MELHENLYKAGKDYPPKGKLALAALGDVLGQDRKREHSFASEAANAAL